MSQLSARFRQSPAETKRYVLDYTLQLATGESIASVAVNIFPQPGPASLLGADPIVINGVALLPPVDGITPGAVFFCSGGVNGGTYDIQFLATTTLTQVYEDVVQFNLAEKLPS